MNMRDLTIKENAMNVQYVKEQNYIKNHIAIAARRWTEGLVMEQYINKQRLLEKARTYQGNIFGVPLIIAEIEKAETIKYCPKCGSELVNDKY